METGRTESRFLHPRIALVFSLILLTACQFFGTSSPAVQEAVATPALSTPPIVVTPVPSPQPTLSLAEKEALALEYYMTNGNCELPCWWGIVPGETEWQTAEHFFSTIAVKITSNAESETDSYYSTSITVPVPEDLSEINLLIHTFIVEDGVIVEIKPEGPWGDRKVDTVSEILSAYGRPTEVWLDTVGYTFGSYYPFGIALFYPEKGILARYWDEADLINDYLIGCPQVDSATLELWSPKWNLSFEETLSRQQGIQYYKPLSEVTGMDVETFYQTYLDPDTETCIETPAELWMDR